MPNTLPLRVPPSTQHSPLPTKTGLEQLLVNAGEAARLLGVSPRTLWGWTKDRLIKVVKIGRVVRYDLRDLQAFIDSQKR